MGTRFLMQMEGHARPMYGLYERSVQLRLSPLIKRETLHPNIRLINIGSYASMANRDLSKQTSADGLGKYSLDLQICH